MFDYLLNRRLRENYKKVLTLQNADEINDFLSKLDESERKDLLSFAFGWAIPNRKKTGAPVRGVQLRKHSKAREKRYSFGYAVSFIFACYQILWTFPKSLYLCSRYLLLAYG